MQILLKSEKFWGVYDPIEDQYSLAFIDIGAPIKITASSENGKLYDVDTTEYSMCPDLTILTDSYIPTTPA